MSLQNKILKTRPSGGSVQLSYALQTPSQYTAFIR
jgi:hypothetical protein